MNLSILSEYQPLRCVLVHRPGREIDRLMPTNLKTLLFEDIPFLDTMQKEHDKFVETLRAVGDIQVVYLEDLLRQVIADTRLREKLIREVVTLENCYGLEADLCRLSDQGELLSILIAGVSAHEACSKRFQSMAGTDPLSHDYFLIPPIPNLYFMRDPGAIIGNGVVASKMHYSARVRESLLVEFVFLHHPEFHGRVRYLFGFNATEQRPLTIEGGDIIVLNRKAIAVGCSERTRSESIRRLAATLFREQGFEFEKVYEVLIPFKRDYMHLDTVFTMVGPNEIVVHPDALEVVPETRVYRKDIIFGHIEASLDIKRQSFLETLDDELGDIHIIKTGDGDPRYASREQLADGTNVFAIAPRKVITYDRNKETNKALRRAGIDVIEIVGSELVRGLGGPRCMTMPIEREG